MNRARVLKTAWKSNLTREIVTLEDNLNQLFEIASLKAPQRIVEGDADELSINEQSTSVCVDNIHQAANNICLLISSKTEFELPIPVWVLIRLATNISSLRWTDYKKKITGPASRKLVYLESPRLIYTSLILLKWISLVAGTNIIPFQPYINHFYFNILEWTRLTDMLTKNRPDYIKIRSLVLANITFSAGQLALNLNFDPQQLKRLIELELIGAIDELGQVAATSKDEECYVVTILNCLDRLYMVYANFLDSSLEYQVKIYVTQKCIQIYRDFEGNSIASEIRQQLLTILETIASQPYATTTTELAWNVFELAHRVETHPDLRQIADRALKRGLAHRPIIVSHHEVYNVYGAGLLTSDQMVTRGSLTEKIELETSSHDSAEICTLVPAIAEPRGDSLGTKTLGNEEPVTEALENGHSVTKELEVEILEAEKSKENNSSTKATTFGESSLAPEHVTLESEHDNLCTKESMQKSGGDSLGMVDFEDDPIEAGVEEIMQSFVNKPATQ